MPDNNGKSLKNTDSVTPELVKRIIDEACNDIEQMFGEEAAMFYRAGLLDCVSLLERINKLQGNRAVDLYQAFAPTKKSTGGIN